MNEGGLSARTLAISAVASLVAAVVVREIWGPGAIIGAAITPVLVALVSESLNRPAQKVTSLAAERKTRTRVQQTPGGTRISAPPEREDRFGIWEAAEPRRLDRKHVRIGIATGLVAFLLVAVALTASELVFGGSVTGGSKTTVFGGKKSGGDDRDPAPATTTQTQEEDEVLPPETTPTTPEETVPQETVPEETTPETVPEETVPQETVPQPTAPAEPIP